MSRTKEQNENLLKLANHLESLPEDYEHFGMQNFFIVESDENLGHFPDVVKNSEALSHCGTVACAVGHGPFIGIEPLEGEYWTAYSERVFTRDLGEWDWCFGSNWVFLDNTAQGAAKRIKVLLNKGLPDLYIDCETPVYSDVAYSESKMYKATIRAYNHILSTLGATS